MSPKTADESRDQHVRRRVERQRRLIELLAAARRRVTLGELAETMGVSERTVARDVERLRSAGLPLLVTAGSDGGAELVLPAGPVRVRLDLPEVAALLSSLAVLGPMATDAARSAMRALVEALDPDATPVPAARSDPTRAVRVIADLTVLDVDTAKTFYVDFLGLDTEEFHLGWVARYTASDTGAMVQLVTHDATAPVDPVISVQVEDVDAAYEEARRSGYDIVHPLTTEPWGVRRFFVRAPDGNVVNVVRHRP